MRHTLGQVQQLGFVIDDIQGTMRHWTHHLGVGPFFLLEGFTFTEFTHRGVPSQPLLDMAFAQWGTLQIELIRQRNDAPSSYIDFRAEGSEGLQHVAVWTTAFDSLTRQAHDMNLREIQRGRSGGGADDRFAYFDAAGTRGSTIEISEYGSNKAAFFDAIAAAARDWDGRRAIRDATRLLS